MLRIVTVAYQNRPLLERWARSLEQHIKIPAEIVIWDNSNPRLDPIKPGHIPLYQVGYESNLGFAKAVNAATEFETPNEAWTSLFLLNPDAWLAGDFTIDDLARLESLQGLVGLRVYDDAARTRRQANARAFPSLMTSVAGREGLLTRLWPRNPWTHRYLQRNLDDVREITRVDWVSGCALFATRVAWEKLGGFDERYFLYVEDVDLGREAKEKKVPVYYYPGVDVVHESRGSSSLQPFFSDLQHHRGMFHYHWKWSGFWGRALSPFVQAGILARFFTRRFWHLFSGRKRAPRKISK